MMAAIKERISSSQLMLDASVHDVSIHRLPTMCAWSEVRLTRFHTRQVVTGTADAAWRRSSTGVPDFLEVRPC